VSIKPIDRPLPGERVIALSPESNVEAAAVWLARPNLFAGRALTQATLQRRQRWQAGRLALRGQVTTAGVVHGLEVGHEVRLPTGADVPQITLTIAPGLGLAASGEDVVLSRPHTVDLRNLPVFAEPSVEVGLPEPGNGAPPADGVMIAPDPVAVPDSFGFDGADPPLRARAFLKRTLGTLFDAAPDAIARVGVLVLQPIEYDRLGEFNPADPCELYPCGEAGDNRSFEDALIADGVRVAWHAWPLEWQALPAGGPTFRNEIAWTIFSAEAALARGALLPWEQLGVPLALIALDAQGAPLFIDRASVVRLGGRSRNPRLAHDAGRISASWRRAPQWQAQIEQFAEQIADAGDSSLPATTLAAQFTRIPPAGLLPTTAIDLTVLPLNPATEALRSDFFPGSFELDAVPVPLESLDLAIREAAPLGAIELNQPDRVRVLVPVSQAVYEPRLLHEEIIDPEFQLTLDRFLLARARALAARHGLRRKTSELVRLATGRAVLVPAIDKDPQALETEGLEQPSGRPPSGGGWGPPPGGGGHSALATAGLHQHFFSGATARLAVAAGETLYIWSYLDPDDPPRVVMFQWHGGDWEHRAYWSAIEDAALIELGADNTPARRRIGNLPEAGGWVRLEVPASAVALEGTSVNGMAFTLHDGRAAYGPTGRLVAGAEVPWFSNALPAGATPEQDAEPWTFLTPNDLFAPFEPAFGLEPDLANTPLGHSAAIEALLADPALAPLAFEPAGQFKGGVLSPIEREQLAARGIQGFIAFLKSRADRADDLIDFGFVKVQTDTYRLRQLILGTTAATRLAISPALATIAQAQTAVASQERISTFFGELKSAAAPRSFLTTDEPPGDASPLTAGAMAAPAALASPLAASGTIVSSTANLGLTATTGALSGARFDLTDIRASDKLASSLLLKATPAAVADNRLIAVKGSSFTPRDVTDVDPLIGKAAIRTTTIAQRLEHPKALEAKDYSTSTRHDAVQALLRLADELSAEDARLGGEAHKADDPTPGLFAGVKVHGLTSVDAAGALKDPILVSDQEKAQRFVPLAALIKTRSRADALLRFPDAQGDEAAHFSDTADLSDNTIALMRQVEGRVRVYRNAILACERVRDGLRRDTAGAETRLAAWDEQLAEARHDVAVTRALIAEETARLDAINTRRSEALRSVRFLAYIRPREARNLIAPPVHRLDPGLLEAPVPACLKDHDDVPDELTAMLSVVREAPSAWFASVPKLLERLDRTDLLVRAVQSAQIRSQAFALKPQIAIAAAASPAMKAVGLVQARQRQVVLQTRQLATAINVAQITTLPWRGARDQAQEVVSLGDLIDGEHGRGDIARRAAEAYDQMSHVAACLHAEFSAVLPSIRLDWAERLSQFDAAPRLRDLSALPRWPEIDYIDRKQMQGYVDWLFDQMSPREPRAEDMMNGVIRMCLLLAADAPIGRIIAGRLPRPAVARPGVRIPLTAFDPGKLRIGMQALIYSGPQVLVRATVEDIGSEVSVRVTHTATAEVNLGADARVQFSQAAQVTLARPPAKQAAVRAIKL
jgi:hypothetical protein